MLIIAALSIEIAPLLNVLSAKKVKAYSNKTALFHAGKHDLLITGVGPIMAKRTLVAYLDEYRPNFILNIGTAGMLNQELKLGEIYHIASVITENENEIALHLLTGEAGETCLSVRRCIEDSGLRDHSHKKHQARLADMECYAIAAIAKENNIPMSSMKITTDFADCESTEMFKKQIEKSAKKLSIEVQNIIKTIEEKI